MPSTKAKSKVASKRVSLPRAVVLTKQFSKDWARQQKAGTQDLARLKHLMLLLIANDGVLGPEWKDHALSGAMKGSRDAHVHGDFLLIYRIDDPAGEIVFQRCGTHSDLFG